MLNRPVLYAMHIFFPNLITVLLYGCFAAKLRTPTSTGYKKRALRTLYNESLLDLDELIKLDNVLNIHKRNIQTLLIEIYKSMYKINPEIMWDIFFQKNLSYNFRSSNLLKLPSANTINYRTNAYVFRGSLIWNNLPDSLKNAHSPSFFKSELIKLDDIRCNCKICS